MRGFLFYIMLQWLENNLTSCFFKSHFGIDCPGCGMQRAFIALLKGNLSESIHYHPALIPFMLTVAVVLIQIKIKHPKGGLLALWLFIITSAITVINYTLKLI